VRPDGSDLRQLTTTSSTYVQQPGSWRPAWSPDGQRIAFSSNRSGTSDVFVMDADGGNPVNLTDSPGLNSFAPAWLPDGRLSYTARGRERDLAEGNALGVAGILLQAGLLIGVVLVAARRWRLPLGACTFVFVLDAVLMSFQNDLFQFIPAAALAGVVADLVLFRLGPLGMASAGGVRRLAFIVPAVYFAGYFAALALTQGVGWTVHLWAGSVTLAGLVGVLEAVRTTSVQPDPSGANSVLFDGISAAVIGGTLLAGGSGTVVGAFLGSLVLAELLNGFNLIGVNANPMFIVQGVAILVAMIANVHLTRLRRAGRT
jgi:hypothetical protein